MTRLAKCMQSGVIAVLLVFLAVQPSGAKILKWQDSPQNRQDLFLLGFGELTMHALDVSGGTNAVDAFEAANPNLKADFCTNYRLSLFANGNATKNFHVNGAVIVDSRIGEEYYTVDPTVYRLRMSVKTTEPIWDGWRFTGHGVYDPARQWELENLDKRLLTQPQDPSKLELLMRFESDEHGLIEGGSIRPSFKNSAFTLHQRSIFGAYADLRTGGVGAEAVAGKLEGKAFRESGDEGGEYGIPADGTGGPFDLKAAPITRGSEEVKIQVRDRFNESTVLSTRKLVRDIDYTVDYLLGRILLHRPVASETAAADPVYIVITYDYLREADDDIYGGRAHVMPGDGFRASGSILHRNIDDRATGDGVPEPEDLFAGDASVKISDHTTGYVEVAGSENPNVTEDYSALRFGAKSEVIDNLTLKLGFQRIDDQFRSFTNSDLDPTKNQRRLNVGGDYQLTAKQKLSASYANFRGLEANGQYNSYDGLRDEKIIALGYRNDWIDKLGFGVRYERRDVEDADDINDENNSQDRAILDAGGRFEDVALLGKLGYEASYELIMFRNELTIGKNDANTKQLALSLSSQPSDQSSFKVTQRFSVRDDLIQKLYDERQDVTIAMGQVRLHENLNTLTNYEYKRYTEPGTDLQLWQDDPLRTQWAANFAIEYLPLEKVKALGKVGRLQARNHQIDSLAIDNHLLGQVSYFHTHHLSFHGESELTSRSTHHMRRTRDKIWDLGLRVNWNRDRLNEFTAGMIRRWNLEDHPPGVLDPDYEEIKATSYILLFSGSMSLTERLFARASYKGILLNDPIDDEKTLIKLEVGYDSHDWFRASIGYERINSDNNESPDDEYTGQGVFVRFTGKM